MKPFRKILTDAAILSTCVAALSGLAFWAVSESVDYNTPFPGPVVVTDDAYVVIGTAETSLNLTYK